MSTLTPAARVAVETINAALESLDEADREAVTRALNVYFRPPIMVRDNQFKIPPEFPLPNAPEPTPAPPRTP